MGLSRGQRARAPRLWPHHRDRKTGAPGGQRTGPRSHGGGWGDRGPPSKVHGAHNRVAAQDPCRIRVPLGRQRQQLVGGTGGGRAQVPRFQEERLIPGGRQSG